VFHRLNGVTTKIVLRYTLLQIPELILLIIVLIWLDLGFILSTGIFILWLAKDIILFFFVWQAYDWQNKGKYINLPEGEAEAVENLHPEGYVEVQGELWRARIKENTRPVAKGEKVKICDRRGLTLIVESINTRSTM